MCNMYRCPVFKAILNFSNHRTSTAVFPPTGVRTRMWRYTAHSYMFMQESQALIKGDSPCCAGRAGCSLSLLLHRGWWLTFRCCWKSLWLPSNSFCWTPLLLFFIIPGGNRNQSIYQSIKLQCPAGSLSNSLCKIGYRGSWESALKPQRTSVTSISNSKLNSVQCQHGFILTRFKSFSSFEYYTINMCSSQTTVAFKCNLLSLFIFKMSNTACKLWRCSYWSDQCKNT